MKISNVEIFINFPDSPSSLFKRVLLKHKVIGNSITYELSDWQITLAEYHGITLRYVTEESEQIGGSDGEIPKEASSR